MTPTTYWISRGGQNVSGWADDPDPLNLELHSDAPPRWLPFAYQWQSHGAKSRVSYVHWPALGLPHEPAPGECWRVDWTEHRAAGQLDDPQMIATARNVTAELKEKADG